MIDAGNAVAAQKESVQLNEGMVSKAKPNPHPSFNPNPNPNPRPESRPNMDPKPKPNHMPQTISLLGGLALTPILDPHTDPNPMPIEGTAARRQLEK